VMTKASFGRLVATSFAVSLFVNFFCAVNKKIKRVMKSVGVNNILTATLAKKDNARQE
jgi:hypothetical protein